MNTNAFRNQVVIVMGASSSIGRSLALLPVGQGADVAIAADGTTGVSVRIKLHRLEA
jgi:NAD(P)-dependent dehydrogenase (short-subunit alcohol dehydrogenase family)